MIPRQEWSASASRESSNLSFSTMNCRMVSRACRRLSDSAAWSSRNTVYSSVSDTSGMTVCTPRISSARHSLVR
ncbi:MULTISPECIES: hypothetical protein [Butyricimonas]|uniref:hypothetical protein n=1 Tax=Butyricimonas TaxID=574697 RepID=UPI001D067E21|nr:MULTISPECIES: hypothetical protein [Butyricimonas]MCB6974953.1 hypothetical protein [Butyricimonas synergistica]MCG4521664.1 hypothetical protein [Butyricimonas sp. DFI.6.44]